MELSFEEKPCKKRKDFRRFSRRTSFANPNLLSTIRKPENHFRVVYRYKNWGMPSLEIKSSDGFGILSRMQKESGRRCRLCCHCSKEVETLGYADGENLLHVLKLSKIYQKEMGEKETTVDGCWDCLYWSWQPVRLMDLSDITADSADFF